jgi:hypothetical protein
MRDIKNNHWIVPYVVIYINIQYCGIVFALSLSVEKSNCIILQITNIVYMIYCVVISFILIIIYFIYIKANKCILTIALIMYFIYIVPTMFYVITISISIFASDCNSKLMMIMVSSGCVWHLFTISFLALSTMLCIYGTKKLNRVVPFEIR